MHIAGLARRQRRGGGARLVGVPGRRPRTSSSTRIKERGEHRASAALPPAAGFCMSQVQWEVAICPAPRSLSRALCIGYGRLLPRRTQRHGSLQLACGHRPNCSCFSGEPRHSGLQRRKTCSIELVDKQKLPECRSDALLAPCIDVPGSLAQESWMLPARISCASHPFTAGDAMGGQRMDATDCTGGKEGYRRGGGNRQSRRPHLKSQGGWYSRKRCGGESRVE